METISITYNNSVIATLTAGQGITLSCGGTKMASDIIIESDGAAATITYKDKTIATLTAGGKITLPCKDKIAQSDIYVKCISAEQLSTPVIEVSGDYLNIYDESGLAEEFEILVDGEAKETVEVVPFKILNPLNGGTLATPSDTLGESITYQYQLSKPARAVTLYGDDLDSYNVNVGAKVDIGYYGGSYATITTDGLLTIVNQTKEGQINNGRFDCLLRVVFTDERGVEVSDVLMTDVYDNSSCFVKNTLVTLSTGISKFVQDITYEDDLLVWNFDEGRYSSAKPAWILRKKRKAYYYKLTFDNGQILNLINRGEHVHRIYCVDTNHFEYANDCVGKNIMTRNGVVKLLSYEKVDEPVDYYNIITDYHMNLYANNVLTSTGFSNIYPVKDMKYVVEERPLIPIEAFENCPEKYYYGFRLGEQVEYTIDGINKKIRRIAENAVENWD